MTPLKHLTGALTRRRSRRRRRAQLRRADRYRAALGPPTSQVRRVAVGAPPNAVLEALQRLHKNAGGTRACTRAGPPAQLILKAGDGE